MAGEFLPHMQSETLSVESEHGVRDTCQIMDFAGAEAESDVQYRIVRFMLDTGFRFVSGGDSNRPGQSGGESASTDQGNADVDVRAEIKATFAAEYQILHPEIESDEEAL